MEIFILLFVLSAIIVFIKEYIKDRRTPSEPTQEPEVTKGPEVTKEHTHIVSAGRHHRIVRCTINRRMVVLPCIFRKRKRPDPG